SHPDISCLFSLRGFLYCDLLLARGEWQEVERRVDQTIVMVSRLFSIALDHLSWGRAALLEIERDGLHDFRKSAARLGRAVEGLPQPAASTFLPLGLLARADLRCAQGDPVRAQADLDEVLALSTRCGMRLHEANAHLGFARLHLAAARKDEARASLERA